MNAAVINANLIAKNLLASLKSGVPLKGTVRRHSTGGATGSAWIGIELPVIGERVVLVKDQRNLQPGQTVLVECVPNPTIPEHYLFQMAASPEPAAGA
jgi:hypothetical protein